MRKNLPDKIEKVYKFAPLDAYSRRKRMTIRLADLIFYAAINLFGVTTRFETDGWEHLEKLERENIPPIYVFWHNNIFVAVYPFRRRKMVVITSQSFDGEYIARFLTRFGFGAIRGSSTRGGVKALVEMIHLMREGLPMTFTADGPKGPKYTAKPGAILLAKKTGCPVVVCSVTARRFWSLKSWDNLQIAPPFNRAKIFVSAPIYVSKEANDLEIEEKRLEMQNRLDELVELGEQWRDSFNN